MDPFATLGVPARFDLDLAAVEKVHRELSRALHPDRYASAGASERRAALGKAIEVNEAWRVVRDPLTRAHALLALRGAAVAEGKEAPADPAFLMEMLELRESLDAAKQARDATAVARMAADVNARYEAALAEMSAGFDRLASATGSEGALLAAKLGELRYYRRFLDEVSAIEDELLA